MVNVYVTTVGTVCKDHFNQTQVRDFGNIGRRMEQEHRGSRQETPGIYPGSGLSVKVSEHSPRPSTSPKGLFPVAEIFCTNIR